MNAPTDGLDWASVFLGRCSMEKTAPRRNILPLLFLHPGVAVVLVAAVMCGVLQLGGSMTACGGVHLLRLSLGKMAVLGSGDHGEDSWPT